MAKKKKKEAESPESTEPQGDTKEKEEEKEPYINPWVKEAEKEEVRELKTVMLLLGRFGEIIPESQNTFDKALAWGVLHDLKPTLPERFRDKAETVMEDILKSLEEGDIGSSSGNLAQAVQIIFSKPDLKGRIKGLIVDDTLRKGVFDDAEGMIDFEEEEEEE